MTKVVVEITITISKFDVKSLADLVKFFLTWDHKNKLLTLKLVIFRTSDVKVSLTRYVTR